ncbi:MFS transporter [Streptomyces sp. NPDC050619]|uniref:MFS transporter n=1 Tax=Streptomyces sp. NPDC050619 TaxID=3157214 RepID=UPI00343D6CAF
MYLTDRSAPSGADTEQGRRRGPGPKVAPVVLVLGTVSLITDISSEMVTAVLPLYLVSTLGFTPLLFGTLDGVYNGAGALVQLTGGHLADRVRNHKLMAGLGYGLSALCKPLLLIASSLGALGTVLALDRTGKGLRTAPRDAMISLSTPPENQGRAFGVHRAMDTTGAMLGPLAAFLILSVATDGYDAVFGVSACVAALGVIVLVLFVPGREERARAGGEGARTGGGGVRAGGAGVRAGGVGAASEGGGAAAGGASVWTDGGGARADGAGGARADGAGGARADGASVPTEGAGARAGGVGVPAGGAGAATDRAGARAGGAGAALDGGGVPAGGAGAATDRAGVRAGGGGVPAGGAGAATDRAGARADRAGAALDGVGVPAGGAGAAPGAASVADGKRPVRVREALALLRLPRLRALAGCAALLGLTTVSDAFVYLLLQRRAGIGEQWFTLLPLGTAVVFLLLAVPVGALADRIGRRTVFLTGHMGLLTAYALLLWAPATPALPFLVLALHGTFYAATDGVLPATLADIVPEQLRASGLAIVGTCQALARFCCSLAFGAAWTVWGDGPALAGAAIGLLCCAAVAGKLLRPAARTR